MFEFFVNPWLLGGLSLASLPIIIHFFNKRRFKVHDWAAMDFLFQAQSTNRRRLKLEDLLLLLLRVLVIAALVFALARPVMQGLAGWREDERVVVLDDSGSMGFLGPTGATFDAGREAAESHILDAFGASVPVFLRAGSRPSVSAAGASGPIAGGAGDGNARNDASAGEDEALAAAEEGSRLLSALRDLEPVDAPLRFDAVLERIIEDASADPTPRVRSVILISDFRRSDWLDETGSLRKGLRHPFEELRRRGLQRMLRFQLVDVGRESAENVAVTGFRLASRHVFQGVPVRFAVEVTNLAQEDAGRPAPRRRIEGEVEIGKPGSETFEPLHRIPIPVIDELSPGEVKVVEVFHTFTEAGEHPVRVSLESDRLRGDDRCGMVVDVREGLRVAVVDGDPQEDRLASESGFLLAALRPRGDDPTGVLPARVVTRIEAKTLEEGDLALILNRSRLDAAERDVLRDFVARGGGVGFFLGNRVDPVAYRALAEEARLPESVVRESAEDLAPLRLFPARIGELREPEPGERRRLAVAEPEHPVFRAFHGIESPSIERVFFDNCYRLEPLEGATVLARYDDGDDGAGTPAIVASRAGKGAVLVFNTSADRDWGDWPTDPSYPVVLHETVRFLAPDRQEERQVTVGEPLVWERRPGETYEVVRPDGERRTLERGSGSALVETYDRTDIAGFYRVSAASSAGGEYRPARDEDGEDRDESDARWFVSRWDPGESDLESVDETSLRRALEPLGVELTFGSEIDVDSFRREQEGEVWRLLAFGAGIFLLLELLLAWWFGRR